MFYTLRLALQKNSEEEKCATKVGSRYKPTNFPLPHPTPANNNSNNNDNNNNYKLRWMLRGNKEGLW